MIKNFKWLLLLSLSIVACNNDDDEESVANEPITAGEADFSRYVALGNSLTSGFSDNALFRTGQENSYPNLLAQQFALANGGTFTLPYMADNTGGLLMGGTMIQGPRLVINGISVSPPTSTNPNPTNTPVIQPFPGAPTTDIMNHLTGPINNMGVPGAKSFHLLKAGYGDLAGVPTGTANPYFARFATTSTATVLEDAMLQNPTFFSLWIGNNDVLSYATSGGAGTNQTGNPDAASYGGNDITDPGLFTTVYTTLVNGLTANGAKGVIANIPYVTSIPYFRTVPFNPVPLDAATVAALSGMSGYGAYNAGLQQALAGGLISQAEATRRTISFHAGAGNAVVMVDSYLTNLAGLGLPSYRQATAEDYIVLPARTFIGTTVGGNPAAVNGVSVPLADSWVLSREEAAEVKTATDAYNVTIKNLADTKNLAFVDANAILNQLANGGIRFGNYHMSASYVTGGAFSLDGVHPAARGYAYLANKFLESINARYGSNFKGVKAEDFPIQYSINMN
ncbi:MAG TPA: G-D-S-L family lipolytic protein [Flavobacterium sp.]|jgi:hydrogenase/urease accessory protein HupE